MRPPAPDPRPGHARALLVALVALVGVASVACSGDDFDRDAAIAGVQQRWEGRLDDTEAACYVDRVREEVGSDALTDESALSPQQVGRLTDIRIDCIGIENLAVVGSSTTLALDPEDTWLRTLPSAYGDDPQLDLLYDACESGSGSACDQLFDLSAPGSEYEEFALSCGGRTRELVCAEVYRGGGATATTP